MWNNVRPVVIKESQRIQRGFLVFVLVLDSLRSLKQPHLVTPDVSQCAHSAAAAASVDLSLLQSSCSPLTQVQNIIHIWLIFLLRKCCVHINTDYCLAPLSPMSPPPVVLCVTDTNQAGTVRHCEAKSPKGRSLRPEILFSNLMISNKENSKYSEVLERSISTHD